MPDSKSVDIFMKIGNMLLPFSSGGQSKSIEQIVLENSLDIDTVIDISRAYPLLSDHAKNWLKVFGKDTDFKVLCGLHVLEESHRIDAFINSLKIGQVPTFKLMEEFIVVKENGHSMYSILPDKIDSLMKYYVDLINIGITIGSSEDIFQLHRIRVYSSMLRLRMSEFDSKITEALINTGIELEDE